MSTDTHTSMRRPVSISETVIWWVVASGSFHAAFLLPQAGFLIILFFHAALQLTRLPGSRFTFYAGLLLGFSIYGPHLCFFWRIFGPAAIALWGVVSSWLALFLVLARAVADSFGRKAAVALVPVLWLGLEYFRSELYYLRFSWLGPGFVFSSNLPWPFMNWLGVHGIGCLACLGAAAWIWLKRPWSHLVGGAVAVLLLSAFIPFAFAPAAANGDQKTLRVAGVQLEFQPTDQIIAELDRVFARHPDTDLFVLSEYTVADELPARINEWCRENRRHLIIGAKDRLSADQPTRGNHYYNTAFVIDPLGEVVFRQAKSVPIQFFQDGQPAPARAVWDSPWGKVGIGVCYDLSYSRIMDDLVRLGAELLIIPTMDVVDWGEYEHQLHSRVTPIRASEYGLPIFRLSSSGISQSLDAKGRVRAIAPFPGQGEIITDELLFAGSGHLPIDRIVAPPAVVITLIVALGCLAQWVWTRKGSRKSNIAIPIENPLVSKEKPNPCEIVSE